MSRRIYSFDAKNLLCCRMVVLAACDMRHEPRSTGFCFEPVKARVSLWRIRRPDLARRQTHRALRCQVFEQRPPSCAEIGIDQESSAMHRSDRQTPALNASVALDVEIGDVQDGVPVLRSHRSNDDGANIGPAHAGLAAIVEHEREARGRPLAHMDVALRCEPRHDGCVGRSRRGQALRSNVGAQRRCRVAVVGDRLQDRRHARSRGAA